MVSPGRCCRGGLSWLLAVLSVSTGACVTPSAAHLEIVEPFRLHLHYAPAWFGTIVLPPGRVTAELQYAGDACETLLGRFAVRGKVVLVDRGRCSFVQKAVHAEQAGALAVIIANDSNEYFIMTDDGTKRQVKVHSFLIAKADADRIKSRLPCAPAQATLCDPDASHSIRVAFGLGFQTRAHYKISA